MLFFFIKLYSFILITIKLHSLNIFVSHFYLLDHVLLSNLETKDFLINSTFVVTDYLVPLFY